VRTQFNPSTSFSHSLVHGFLSHSVTPPGLPVVKNTDWGSCWADLNLTQESETPAEPITDCQTANEGLSDLTNFTSLITLGNLPACLISELLTRFTNGRVLE
jgi:hypothetical protein